MSYVSRDLFLMNIDKLAGLAEDDQAVTPRYRSSLHRDPKLFESSLSKEHMARMIEEQHRALASSYAQKKRQAQRKTSQGVSEIGEGLRTLGSGVKDYWMNQFDNGARNLRRGWARGAAKRAQITQAAEANRQSR